LLDPRDLNLTNRRKVTTMEIDKAIQFIQSQGERHQQGTLFSVRFAAVEGMLEELATARERLALVEHIELKPPGRVDVPDGHVVHVSGRGVVVAVESSGGGS